jgi:putative transposase
LCIRGFATRAWSFQPAYAAHVAARDDGLAAVAPLLDRCAGRFADRLDDEQNPAPLTALRAAETLGRPLGSPDFLDRLAARTGRDPRPGKRGCKKQEAGLTGFGEFEIVKYACVTDIRYPTISPITRFGSS